MPPKVEGFQDGPDAVGVDLYVGRTHNCLCPVVAMLRYLAAEVNSKEKSVIGERDTLRSVQSRITIYMQYYACHFYPLTFSTGVLSDSYIYRVKKVERKFEIAA